jgi:hypothetical protein
MDTAWSDEEWGAIADDTLADVPLPEGVDWPELEALRRRIGAGLPPAGGEPMDTAFERAPLPAPLPTPLPAPPEPRPLPTPLPEGRDTAGRGEPAEPPPPHLLGRPVQRDSTPTAPPDSVPATPTSF